MATRLMALLAIAAYVVAVPAGAGAQDRGPDACWFEKTDRDEAHDISSMRNITCAEAKRVLRGLRGKRDTIPMDCGGTPRRVAGWTVANVDRGWSSTVSSYARGRQRFEYMRSQDARRVWCPPEGLTSEGV